MLRALPAMLHVFAATLCEGEDAIYEESGHYHPFRGRGSQCAGRRSERETARYARVAMPTAFDACGAMRRHVIRTYFTAESSRRTDRTICRCRT
jgi:hypothetical protein